MKILDEIVKECLMQHEGGEKFFDHLDMAIQKKPIIDEFMYLVEDFDLDIIVSGKFGEFFMNYYSNNSCIPTNIIHVNGGLRKGEKINDLNYLKNVIKDTEFIFIDDSFYSGKTRDTVKNEIERLGGKLVKTYVVYDGSIEKDESVFSLYRYYNN